MIFIIIVYTAKKVFFLYHVTATNVNVHGYRFKLAFIGHLSVI